MKSKIKMKAEKKPPEYPIKKKFKPAKKVVKDEPFDPRTLGYHEDDDYDMYEHYQAAGYLH